MFKRRSLRDTPYLNGEVMAELSMKSRKRIFVFVEGPSDVTFFSKFINQSCKIFPVNGKKNVLLHVKEASKKAVCFGIADKDYDYNHAENVFFTDTNDIENMILRTGTFESFEEKYGDKEKIKTLLSRKNNDKLIDAVGEICKTVGKIRYVNNKYDFNVNFKVIPLGDYIDKDLNFLNNGYMDRLLFNKTLRNSVEGAIARLCLDRLGYWDLARGHDLTETIVVFFSTSKSNIGNSEAVGLTQLDVEHRIAELYDKNNFKKTKMYDSLKKWEQEHEASILYEI